MGFVSYPAQFSKLLATRYRYEDISIKVSSFAVSHHESLDCVAGIVSTDWKCSCVDPLAWRQLGKFWQIRIHVVPGLRAGRVDIRLWPIPARVVQAP